MEPGFSEVCSPDFICNLNKWFYDAVPAGLRKVTDEETGKVHTIEPGKYRKTPVKVGRHIPPELAPTT